MSRGSFFVQKRVDYLDCNTRIFFFQRGGAPINATSQGGTEWGERVGDGGEGKWRVCAHVGGVINVQM